MDCNSGPFGSVASAKSCPAQNAFPSPVITIALTSSLSTQSSSAFCKANAIDLLNELNTSGRFILNSQTPFVIDTIISIL